MPELKELQQIPSTGIHKNPFDNPSKCSDDIFSSVELKSRNKIPPKVWVSLGFGILGILAIILLIIFFGQDAIAFVYGTIFALFDWIGSIKEPLKSLLLLTTSYGIQVFGIPIGTMILILTAYCLKSFFWGFVYNFAVCLLNNSTLFYIFSKQLQSGGATSHFKFLNPEESPEGKLTFVQFLINLLEKYIQEHPYAFGMAIRTLQLPDYVKIFVLVKCKTKFIQMLIPCLLVDSLNMLLYSFIGSQLQNKFEILEAKSWGQKSSAQKVVTIFSIFLVVVQVGVIIAGCVYTKRKYEEYEQSGTIEVTPAQSQVFGLQKGEEKVKSLEDRPTLDFVTSAEESSPVESLRVDKEALI